jgi:hypothetical protein
MTGEACWTLSTTSSSPRSPICPAASNKTRAPMCCAACSKTPTTT